MKIDAGFAEEVIARAIRSGADQAEIFIKSSKNLSVEVKDQSVESLKSSLSFGYSLRIIKEGRLGFSYSNEAGDEDFVIRNAIDAAKYADEDLYLELPEGSEPGHVEVFDQAIRDIAGDASSAPRKDDDAINKIMLMERAVYEKDKRIKRVRKALGSFASSETAILNSRSVKAGYLSTSCSAQITAVAEEGGESQAGWDFEGSRFLRDISFEGIGNNAAGHALRLLGSRKIKGCKADVILDNSVTVDFLGIFASSLSSEAVQKGKSLLAGRIGEKVISSRINMIDSGLLPGKMGSGPVDDEGVSAKGKILINEGTLRTYLYNTYTSKKGGAFSTGNAVRGGFSSLPSVGITNLFLDAVSKKDFIAREKMFGAIDRGLYIVDAMGVHTANPISGEFSVGVTGVWIENGEEKYPVKEAVISGNILEFFNKVEAVGDDLRFYGNIGAPSLIISGVDISA